MQKVYTFPEIRVQFSHDQISLLHFQKTKSDNYIQTVKKMMMDSTYLKMVTFMILKDTTLTLRDLMSLEAAMTLRDITFKVQLYLAPLF